jgi:hypothetical protein
MYLFLKQEVNDKSAFVGSLLYLFAPVRFMEMHFRVSVGTDAAFIFIPLAFFFVKKSLEKKWIFVIFGSINFLFLILSHSSITFIIIPASLIYAFVKKKRVSELIYPLISFALGLGLSAYYMLPALLEIKYTWYSLAIRTVNEFYSIWYYLYSPARFGLLFQGNNGELRLIIGYAQLLIVLIAIYYLFRKKFYRKDKNIIVFLLLFFVISFSLMLSFTKPLWNNIFFLRSFVLPWRMLVPISFTIGFLGAFVVKTWNKKIIIIFCLFIILSTILNWGNRKMIPMSPNAYNSQWVLYTEYYNSNNPIYLLRYNALVTKMPQLVTYRLPHIEILSGNGQIKELSRTQIDHKYIAYAKTNLTVSENTFYFPGWNVYIDGKKTQINIQNKKRFGDLAFYLPKGTHLVEARFTDTSARIIGKVVSLITLILIISVGLLQLFRLKPPKS